MTRNTTFNILLKTLVWILRPTTINILLKTLVFFFTRVLQT